MSHTPHAPPYPGLNGATCSNQRIAWLVAPERAYAEITVLYVTCLHVSVSIWPLDAMRPHSIDTMMTGGPQAVMQVCIVFL